MKRTALVGAAAWAVPSIISTDPVAAAAGSCVAGGSTFDFATGLQGWTIDNAFGPGQTGLWNASLDRGGGALHYGRGMGGNYRTGNKSNSGAVTSPSFVIPATGVTTVVFDVFRDVENWYDSSYDVLRFSVVGASNAVLWQAGSDGGTGGVFQTITVTVPTSFNSSTVSFRFDFDTRDGIYNTFEGIYVSRFHVGACSAPAAPAAFGLFNLGGANVKTAPAEFPPPVPPPKR